MSGWRQTGYRDNRLTGVCLNPSGDLSCSYSIEVGNILVKDRLEITFTNSLRGCLAGVYPKVHVEKRTFPYTNASNAQSEKVMEEEEERLTDVCHSRSII